LQEAVDAIDEMMKGNLTLNDLFSKLRLPKRSEAAAKCLLNAIVGGFESIPAGALVNIRPLFPDDLLYQIVEIRRVQMIQGIS
jgi:hypothetical protein